MNVKDKILERLVNNKGMRISGEQLAGDFSVSRTTIWKHIKALRDEGYMIDSSTNLGYSLTGSPDILTPGEISAGINVKIIGKEIKYFKEIDSTNMAAREMAASMDEGTVVIAESQTAGRGRLGRKWISPEGGIWLSIILKPRIQPVHAPRITLLAGVSVAKAVRTLDLPAKIKWPNDILINGRKVCGILTEIGAEADLIEYIIVGIGIDANVDIDSFPEEIRDSSTSLMKETGKKINRVDFVRRLLEEFDAIYLKFQKEDYPPILEEWRKLSATIGEWVKITTQSRSIYGEAVGIDNEGSLILETGDGHLEKVVAGNCEHLRRLK